MKNTDTPDNIPYQLIFEEQNGTLTDEDKVILETWKAEATENLNTYRQIIDISEDFSLLEIRNGLNPEKSWEVLSQSIFSKEEVENHIKLKPAKISYIKWMAAAAVLLIVGLAIAVNMRSWIDTQYFQTGINEHKQLILPDGSEVFMNQNTSLRYNNKEFMKSRNVEFIKGEAYFKVIHDLNSPFLIRIGELDVMDLGTSFNLCVDPKATTVVVSSGKVAMKQHKTQEKIILKESDKGIFNKSTQTLVQHKNDNINYKAWYDKTLHYQQTPLGDVARDLEQVYGTRILFGNDALKERRLNGYYKNKKADEIIEIIGSTLNLKVTKKDNQYLFENP
ncbi:FecR family protein [Pedobacter psychrotolerans]|uniref:FecR family protein n=1 Tax=Pedobacter psychrotolerans TaxID=1843235 RepID=A0A4R2HM75_9SPHI|nr:FecR domain-containing protein [Pedobacter psychrotolerans]TCO28875.1 FecR family protein [Pedobacter psychrotolerans]GGE52515.1 hypothetical protein GCM10011413_18480 [Pedobacter psychrotolerans]